MQKPKFSLLLITITIAFVGSVSSLAQQSTASEKKSLIAEFRVLTGANKVDGSINLSPDSIRQVFTSIIEQDKELPEGQRVEFRKSADEATARIYKMAQDSVADKAQIIELSENTIYQIYDRAFTESELKELVTFYRTPTGQKATDFLRGLSSQVQKEFGEVIRVKLNNVLQPAIQIEIEKLEQKIKEAKAKKEAHKTTFDESVLWLNLPSAPLKFVEQEGNVALNAKSSPGPIKSYGLGCVRQDGDRIKVIKRFGIVIVNSPAEMTRFWLVPSGQHGLPKCAVGDKYSIFEVAYIDGAVWRI